MTLDFSCGPFTSCTSKQHNLQVFLHLQTQGVKWEDTSKKEEKEGILLEKEDQKRTLFSFKLNAT